MTVLLAVLDDGCKMVVRVRHVEDVVSSGWRGWFVANEVKLRLVIHLPGVCDEILAVGRRQRRGVDDGPVLGTDVVEDAVLVHGVMGEGLVAAHTQQPGP